MQLPKIVIPSHKRHDRVVSKKLLIDPILCVEESQEAIYRDHNPGIEIVVHPDSVKGLMNKRQWMMDHFGDLFMVDDDVYFFSKTMAMPGEAQQIKDPEFITNKIYQLHELAVLMGINLYGFTKNPRPEQYQEFKPFSLSNMITGCAYGLIKNDERIHYTKQSKLKEDFWISCLHKYYERKILVDNRYNFRQKDTFINPGGLSEIRNTDEELRSMLFIRRNFGESITLKKDTHTAKSKTRHNITARFKY